MLEWTKYLTNLKASAESENLQFFAAKSLMLQSVGEIFNSYGEEHFSYYVVPQSMKEDIISGDYLLLFKNYKVARVILTPETYNKDFFNEIIINKIRNTFLEPIQIDLLLFVWDDSNYHTLIIEPQDIQQIEKKDKKLPKPLKNVLDNYFKVPTIGLGKAEKSTTVEYEEKMPTEDFKHYLLEIHNEYQNKSFRTPKKEALQALEENELNKFADFIIQFLFEEENKNIIVSKIEEYLNTFDKT